jgi:hypothetical protein
MSQPVRQLNVNLNPKDLITYTTAAEIRGVSVQAISRLVQRGSLEMVEIDGHKFVSRKAVERFRPSVGGRPKSKTLKKSN